MANDKTCGPLGAPSNLIEYLNFFREGVKPEIDEVSGDDRRRRIIDQAIEKNMKGRFMMKE